MTVPQPSAPSTPPPDRGPLRVAVTLEQCWHRVPGGTATAAIGSIRALATRPEVDLVGVSARHREPAPLASRPSIPVRQLPLPRLGLYESWHRLRWPAVERATGPVDLIHVTGMAMPPRSAPLVVTVNDLAFLHDASTFTRRGVRFFQRAIDLTRRDADLVICPSQATIDDCVAHGFEPERLRLVPLGVDVEPAGPEAIEQVRARFELTRPFVLWTGTIEPRKNLDGLLAAFARVDRDVELVIAGPEGWNDELAAIEARRPGRVRRIGFVDPADLGPLYAAAAVFCFPSWREGFGLPVLEAMAQGTPVITSSGTATEEVVGDAGMLVAPDDVAGLASAMDHLLGDPDAARALGRAGQDRARLQSWARTADRLVAVYREAVDVAAPTSGSARRGRRS